MEKQIMKAFHIQRQSPVPLYFQLKNQLLELLKKGVFQPGDKLPTEAEFCALLDISRPTVRQAFSELINEGYIVRHKAKGTFVAEPKIEGRFFMKLESFDEEMRALGLTPSTRVLGSEVIPTPADIKEVYPNSAQVFHLQRLRYANEEERVLVHTYVPYDLFPNIEQEDFSKVSLYEVFEETYHTRVAYADRSVEAKQGSRYELDVLQMGSEGVIMHIVTTAYTKDNQPIEYSIADYRGDRNSFKMRLIATDEEQ